MATKTGGGNFPTTNWGLFADVRSGSTEARLAALDILSRRYWRPVFVFLRRFGHDEETAKDLTQAFFAAWIENDVFAKADQTKGRFRTFMLSCLKRFVSNEHRADNAQKRKPAAGLLSLDELMDNTQMPFEPAGGMTPDIRGRPRQVKYPRNTDLDPQLVWRGKDEQDWSDLVVHAPPLYI